MTEDEAKKALFRINAEYMMHTPKERLALYDEYQEKRGLIRKQLAEFVMERKEEELKKK